MTDPQAESVVFTFGTFRQLMEATNDRSKDATEEIANCAVSTRADGTARAKAARVGNALATRVTSFLTGKDPLSLMN